VEFVVVKVALGRVFSGYCDPPQPVFIPPYAPHSSLIRGWYDIFSSDPRTRWTQPHPPPELKLMIIIVCYLALSVNKNPSSNHGKAELEYVALKA
jgi:hypothetical protein